MTSTPSDPSSPSTGPLSDAEILRFVSFWIWEKSRGRDDERRSSIFQRLKSSRNARIAWFDLLARTRDSVEFEKVVKEVTWRCSVTFPDAKRLTERQVSVKASEVEAAASHLANLLENAEFMELDYGQKLFDDFEFIAWSRAEVRGGRSLLDPLLGSPPIDADADLEASARTSDYLDNLPDYYTRVVPDSELRDAGLMAGSEIAVRSVYWDELQSQLKWLSAQLHKVASHAKAAKNKRRPMRPRSENFLQRGTATGLWLYFEERFRSPLLETTANLVSAVYDEPIDADLVKNWRRRYQKRRGRVQGGVS